MGSLNDVMNVDTSLSLEIPFGVQLLTWNVSLHESYEVEV